MLSCRNATALLSLSMERPLTARERLSLRGHLLICGSCRRARRQFGRLREAVRDTADAIIPTAPPMPEDVRARLAADGKAGPGEGSDDGRSDD